MFLKSEGRGILTDSLTLNLFKIALQIRKKVDFHDDEGNSSAMYLLDALEGNARCRENARDVTKKREETGSLRSLPSSRKKQSSKLSGRALKQTLRNAL